MVGIMYSKNKLKAQCNIAILLILLIIWDLIMLDNKNSHKKKTMMKDGQWLQNQDEKTDCKTKRTNVLWETTTTALTGHIAGQQTRKNQKLFFLFAKKFWI